MKMTYVRLLVDDFDACYDFYSNVIGLKPTWSKKGEAYASFAVGESMMLSIFKRELMLKSIEAGEVDRIAGDFHSVLIFDSDDVDADYSALIEKGAATINKPHDMPGWGGRCFHLTDPEGNLIEIYKELPKEAWDEDLRNHPDADQHS